MEKGASEPWSDVLFAATRESKLDGRALREYFQPLEEWLRSENIRTGEFPGWTYGKQFFFNFSEVINFYLIFVLCVKITLISVIGKIYE